MPLKPRGSAKSRKVTGSSLAAKGREAGDGGLGASARALPGAGGNRMLTRLLGGEQIQRKAEDGASTGQLEQEADRAAGAVVSGDQPTVAAKAPGAANLLVEDGSQATGGQMEKSEFVVQLREAVCATADQALAQIGQTTDGCPYIDYWISYYAAKDASYIERALIKFAPEAAGAASARQYIAIAAARVRSGVERYAKTGELPDLPDLPADAAMSMLFKGGPGGASPGDADPAAVRRQLGSGRPLEGPVRSQMESAFGTSFSHVRVHTDGVAAGLSDRMNARAFTVGGHVAFGAGEYHPDTMIGQALLAHELAHVIQQQGATQPAAPARKDRDASSEALERDADRSAGGALLHKMGAAATRVSTQLHSGLSLQRCSKSRSGKLLEDFEAKFADAGKLIRKSPAAMTLVGEAKTAGVEFGGYAEDGPAKDAWPYTAGNKVYVPRARTDAVLAMNGFLFELNNAIRKPQFEAAQTEARKGSKGTLTAKAYARRTVELEVEGMLRLGEVWFEMKKGLTDGSWDKYDNYFYQDEYKSHKEGKKTKDDIVNDVLKRTYSTGKDAGKTTEQFYMDQYNELSGGK